MKKNTTVIIKQNNSKLGDRGNIIKITHGYAFNYLIPNNLVELATKGKLKHAQMLKKIKTQRLEELEIQAKSIKENLEQISKISIKKKVGENQQIFGSVNEKEIITAIFNFTGQKLEKKQIYIPDIKKIGIYSIQIHILYDISVTIKLQILPEHL